MGWIGDLIINVVYGGTILVAAIWVGGFLKTYIVSYSREHGDIDETLFTFLGTIARYALLGFAGVFVLARFGIQTASLVAVIGAAGLDPEKGTTTFNELTQLSQTMAKVSNQVIVMAESEKLQRKIQGNTTEDQRMLSIDNEILQRLQNLEENQSKSTQLE